MTDHIKTDVIAKARALIADMIMELTFRGCNADHPLICRASELVPQLSDMQTQTENPAGNDQPIPAGTSAKKLHQLPAEDVAGLDLAGLSDVSTLPAQGLAPHSTTDLVEAAFTFENELMALLGDENSMPYEVYERMDDAQLLPVIRAAVENRIREAGWQDVSKEKALADIESIKELIES